MRARSIPFSILFAFEPRLYVSSGYKLMQNHTFHRCGWALENARLPRKHVCRTSGQTLAKSSNRSVWIGGVAISAKFGRIAPVLPNWHRSGAPVPSPPRQIHWHNRRHATLLPGVSFLPRADAVPTPARAPMISRALAARGCSWRCFALSCAKACHGTRQMLENGRGGPARIDRTLDAHTRCTGAIRAWSHAKAALRREHDLVARLARR